MGVTPHMKISEVLKEYPQLLDVLVQQSPHFSRLKNPILRRVQARLVTVSQAAAISRLDAAQLVRTLNRAIGEEAPEMSADEAPAVPLSTQAGGQAPDWIGTAKVVAAVDVRESQRRHEDPFAIIMGAAAKVGDGEALTLRNTFEPLPLYDVLGKRGFISWARQLGPEDWEIFFLKNGKASTSDVATACPAPSSNGAAAQGVDPVATLAVDVRDLVPPQPMMRILEALDRLKSGETLLVHHVRRPVYLYPRLMEMGYAHETRELGPDKVDIYITKK